MGHVFALIAIATWAAILMAWGLCDMARQARPLARRAARTLLRALSLLAEGLPGPGTGWPHGCSWPGRDGTPGTGGTLSRSGVTRSASAAASLARPVDAAYPPAARRADADRLRPMVRVGSYVGHEHSWSDRRWN